MGFYPPATLVRDGQRRGVETRPPDVNVSSAKCTVADGAVRIGVDYVNGIGEPEATAVVEERERDGPFQSVRDLAQRTQLSERGLETLIVSGACDCFGMPRRQLLWQLGLVPRSHSVPGSGGEEKQLALPLDPTAATPDLPEPTVWERMLADYRTTNLSVGVHPLELLRAHLPAGVISSRDLEQAPDRAQVAIAGMAVARQRPATANGVVFMLIEDEFGAVNLIVPPSVYDKHRAIVRGEPLILARGRFERIERNQNVLVRSLETLGALARQVSQETEVGASLPGAHHFGHR
jgi:error-prone DNA polymerase